MKKKKNSSLESAFYLFFAIAVLGALVYVLFRGNSGKNSTVVPVNHTTKKQIFPIKVFGTSNTGTITNPVKGAPAPCQPGLFDPKTSKFSLVQQNGTPSRLYKIQGFQDDIDGGVMMIDGWNKEGENKVNLPAPYTVTVYTFGCASSFSYVLDLSKNGVRQALYTHVLHYAFSDDGRYLYLVNAMNNQGNWIEHKRIINIETNTVREIPNLECESELDGFWQGDRLVTYAERKDKSDYQTDICIWENTARLVSNVGATTAWGAASGDYLAEKIGLLPNEPDIFYAYTSRDTNTCSLFLVDITKNEFSKTVDILDKRSYSQSYYCASPEVEFNFSGLSLGRGTLKYRIAKDKQSSGQIIWGDWQVVSM